MSSEHIALVSLAGSLLVTLIISTWKFSSLASQLLAAVKQLEKKDAELESRLRDLDAIPRHDVRIAQVEKNHSYIPQLLSRVGVLEARADFSRELRQIRGSRPDHEDRNEGDT